MHKTVLYACGKHVFFRCRCMHRGTEPEISHKACPVCVVSKPKPYDWQDEEDADLPSSNTNPVRAAHALQA